MTPKPPPKPKLIVGVGASAGGLEAYKRLLSSVAEDTGMAFLFVQHLDVSHESMLAELLTPVTAMPVTKAKAGLEIRPNTVTIFGPDTPLAVRDGRLVVEQASQERGPTSSVDRLFGSLAREYGARAVGIVLSGAGSDGSVGLRAIKAAGGLAFVQTPASSGATGMPRSAIDTGAVDMILEVEEMPAALVRFAGLADAAYTDPPPTTAEAGPAAQFDQQRLGRLATLLRDRLDFDLRAYKPGTIQRRVSRRMVLTGFDSDVAYMDNLRDNLDEQRILVRDLLIHVTDFFRDPQAFADLRTKVVDPLMSEAREGSTLRVWVPACATGEEAYSLGIELLDAMVARERHVSVQIFATDVYDDALAVARAGVYPPLIAERMSPARLATYFDVIEGKGYRVRPALRDTVSFAVHDLTQDPPFSRMHLVSCRNVLIYLTTETQKHVLASLHFALEPNGHLFLGSSESTGPQRELFSTVSKSSHIYTKVGASVPISIQRPRSRGLVARSEDAALTRQHALTPRRPTLGSDAARQAVLGAWVPPAIIVNETGRVTFMHGELGPYLRFPQGDNLQLDLESLLRPEHAPRIRGALYRCRRTRRPQVVQSSGEGRPGRVRITAKPAPELGHDEVILSFEELDEESPMDTKVELPTRDALVDELEEELRATREDLQNLVEELRSSNEELRTSNEESMSMNEELQSANEELEATTEELRSLNEELNTVNTQLREKVVEVEHAHDDLSNFFASTQVATIFLDDRLCMKRFTPSAAELLRLAPDDSGRCVADFAHELLQAELERDAQKVLEHLASQSRELHTRDGRWFIRGVLPYRTNTRQVEGVVVTFHDVTELKSTTEQLRRHERRQRAIAQIGLNASRSVDPRSFMEAVALEVQRTLDSDLCGIFELQPGKDALLLRAGAGWQPGLVGSASVDGGSNTLAGYTFRSPNALTIPDHGGEARFGTPPLLRDHSAVSGISCAIRIGEQEYGTISAHTVSRRTFTREDAEFLEPIANMIGSAIGRDQARSRLAVELGIAQALADSADLDEALDTILDTLAIELRGAVAQVWWLDEDEYRLAVRRQKVTVAADESPMHEVLGGLTFGPGEGFVGRVFANERAALATDLSRPALFDDSPRAAALGLVSGLALPIRAGAKVHGVVGVFSRGRLFADAMFLRGLDSIGRSIGDFVTQVEMEHRVRRLAAITESSHDAILSYDLDGRINEWLVGAVQLFGYTTEEMIGESIERIVPDDRRTELWDVAARIIRGEVVEPFETLRWHKDGRPLEVSIRSSPIKDRQGNVVGISSSDRDFTRLKETERRLIAADRQKDEFLAMLGHELRNPLAAILSAAEVVNLSVPEDSQVRLATAVLDRQSKHMAKLLDGLLDVSRIIRGKIVLDREIFSFDAVCRDIVADTQQRLDGRVLELRTHLPAAPVRIEGDRVRLAQVVDNLLSNAVKYTSDGGTITLVLRELDSFAVLVVRDTGIGIKPELLPHIFEAFRQAEQALDRANGGLGLGLALAKALVELHGGTIEARSEGEGRGSEFEVRLPLAGQAPREHEGARH